MAWPLRGFDEQAILACSQSDRCIRFKTANRDLPDDFMFRLTEVEVRPLQDSRSQIATLKRGQNINYLPYAWQLLTTPEQESRKNKSHEPFWCGIEHTL